MSGIGKLLQSIGSILTNLFKNTVKDLETVVLPAAIAITNAVKTITETDTTDVLGHLAGSAGAALEDKVRSLLPGIVSKLQLAQQFLNSGNDPATILANIMKLVNASPAVTQTAFYVEFSGLVAADLADGKLTLDESVQLAQYFYHNYPQPSTIDISKAVTASATSNS